MNNLAIWTENLVKDYPRVRAVDGLSLNVPRGVTYGFLGRNGAGKTSTIRVLLGLTRPTGGSAAVLGLPVSSDQVAILNRTAYVSETKTLFSYMTAQQLVRFTRGFYSTWSDDAVAKYSKLLEIPMDRPFAKLSQGNRTKVCLVLALAQGAELLIFDEPTTGMDPVVVDRLLRVLVEDGVSEGRTIFISSHSLTDVEQIADWVGIISQGKMLLEASLEDIKAQFRRVTASGSNLPQTRSANVLSVVSEGQFCRYLVNDGAEAFAARLGADGATVVEVSPVGLRDIFLDLVGKEEPCTSGNAGERVAVRSSSVS